jgi:uncharacterized membrane protein YphA (DoxX/SURF4 family)
MKKLQPWLTLAARIILGATLLAAGILKIKHPLEAASSVRVYKLLPVSLANILGYSLPPIEIGLAIFLLVGIWVKRVGAISGILMVVFIIAVGQAWARKLAINCGCFGNGGVTADGKVHPLTYLTEIIRDIGLAALAYYLYRYPHGKLSIDKLDKLDKLDKSEEVSE